MKKELEQIEPQVARGHFDKALWDDNNYIAEEKLDGERFKMHIFTDHNRFDSRRISSKTNLFSEKTDNVPHLRDFKVPDLAGTVLDGEIQFGSDSMSTSSIMGSLPEAAVEKQQQAGQWVEYKVFDILRFKGSPTVNLPYHVRRELLESVYMNFLQDCKYIKLPIMISTKKQEYCNRIWKRGGEGVILKNLQAPYTDKKAWVKVKQEATYDVVIMGYKDPKELSVKKGDDVATATKFAANGWIGAIVFGQYKDGVLTEFGNTSGMPDDVRQMLSENKQKYIGTVITIEAQQRIKKSGKFRHPRFLHIRTDKTAAQCVFYEGEK